MADVQDTPPPEDVAPPDEAEGLPIGELVLGDKIKKKKKKVDRTAELEAMEDGGDAPEPETLDLALKKKKKKKKERSLEELEEGHDAGGEGGEMGAAGGRFPWSGTTREYNYEELLGRVFGILSEKNPELAGTKKRVLLKPPNVLREGTKKTVFANFMELSSMMNRNSEHVQQFLLAELGTSGSLDGSNRLILKGRFQPKAFEVTLRRYINEYVLCHSCKSMDTLLDKDSATRLSYLRCQQCGASRSVTTIKAGFVARVGRRKH
jgi:translation initiation factor 2 subunit 2